MSSQVLPTWAQHSRGWAARRRADRDRRELERAEQAAFTDRTGVIPKPMRKLEGFGVLAAIAATAAIASALPALTPPTPLAAQVIDATEALTITRASSAGPESPPTWQPQLDRMLPILPPR
jgi:hypothetical protein